MNSRYSETENQAYIESKMKSIQLKVDKTYHSNITNKEQKILIEEMYKDVKQLQKLLESELRSIEKECVTCENITKNNTLEGIQTCNMCVNRCNYIKIIK